MSSQAASLNASASNGKRPASSSAAAGSSSSAKAPKLAPIFAAAARQGGGGTMSQDPWSHELLGRQSSCWHGVWGSPKGSKRVLALDLDGTVISTKGKSPFAKDELDWKWWNPAVPKKLVKAHQDGYAIVFISNQAGQPKNKANFQKKIPLIAKSLHGGQVPFHCFAAFEFDEFRKPATGMWDAYVSKFSTGIDIDLGQSVYVGDAAGRASDHNDTDRKMALNAGLQFQTPEEFFLGQPPDAKYTLSGWHPSTLSALPLYSPSHNPLVRQRPAGGSSEVVIFVGMPASGKTTLFRQHFAPAGYVHVNQDTLRTRDKCLAAMRDALVQGKSVVVDNTSPARDTRKVYLDIVRREFPNATVRVLHFTAPVEQCMHNSIHRAATVGSERAILPKIAFDKYRQSFEKPTEAEGFDSIQEVNFVFAGDETERARYHRYYGGVYPKARSY